MKKQLKTALAIILIFVVTYIISISIFKDVYLFKWASDRYFLYIWIIALILNHNRKKDYAYAISIANTVGLFVGEYLGRAIIAYNKTKITANSSNQEICMLSMHHGVKIWLLFIIITVLLLMIFKKYKLMQIHAVKK